MSLKEIYLQKKKKNKKKKVGMPVFKLIAILYPVSFIAAEER